MIPNNIIALTLLLVQFLGRGGLEPLHEVCIIGLERLQHQLSDFILRHRNVVIVSLIILVLPVKCYLFYKIDLT